MTRTNPLEHSNRSAVSALVAHLVIDRGRRGREGKRRKRGEEEEEREKGGGVKQKLKKLKGGRAPLPSVILSNVVSLRSKTDELQANVSYLLLLKLGLMIVCIITN